MNSRIIPSTVLALALAGCATTPPPGSPAPKTTPPALSQNSIQQALQGSVSFDGHVRPVLEAKCIGCHNGTRLRSGFLNLASRTESFSEGPWGPRIVPGNPDRSLLVSKLDISHSPVRATPRIEDRISAEEIAVLRKWIADGAAWPEGEAGKLGRR
jgi:Planctomycete cytochrome C